MSATVFIAVMGAALLHASWNALVKGGADKKLSMMGVILGHVPLALIAVWFVPLPTVASLPYIAAGLVMHFGYQIFLMKAYEAGDLTQVYPIARGSAPLIVTAVSVLALGVALTGMQTLAVLIIGAGIISMALVRKAEGQRNPKAAVMALATGVFIAGYSLIDGLGARVAGSSLSYYSWLSIVNGGVMALYFWRVSPGTFRALPSRQGRRLFIIGGGASFVAYSIVTWAFTQAPIALVTALRETSIVFALVIGVVFLNERLSVAKLASTFATLLGAILLRFAK